MITAEPVMDAVANVKPRLALNDVLPLLKMTRVILGQVGVRSARLRKPFCRVLDGIDKILGAMSNGFDDGASPISGRPG